MKRKLEMMIIVLAVMIASCKKEAANVKDATNEKPALMGANLALAAEKNIYIPNEWQGIDLNNDNSEWSYARMATSANIVIFWDKGFTTNPSQAPNVSLRFNKADILLKAEQVYKSYRDTLKFTGQASNLDTKKLMILVKYSTDWLAQGAGFDNVVGALWVSPAAVNINSVLAHELGHTFQYQVHCDGTYGYRDQNYVGSFWEQCAQYMSRQTYPAGSLDDIKFFYDNCYKNFSNEEIRYQSFHLQEYWKLKYGKDFLGRLWRSATSPEHPLQTYKRITNSSQSVLNNEILDYARRCVNWDLPNGQYVRAAAQSQNAIFKTLLNYNPADQYYTVDQATAPECYGFNVIELNVPTANTATVNFSGINNGTFVNLQGWRYGFVSVNSSGIPTYSTIGADAQGSLLFTKPANTSRVWLVVSGAPQTHFNHEWGMTASQIPKFPYKVKFTNTQPKSL
ncbi:hypothetical protein AY601_1104 [Pedobacter cryoconitis]|uniref:DUF4859 domain-containing protein n=1 Tax=Pedobacter cryoconitis TaxID=188932 RepID=A0A127V9E9_9SPHI|nr:DUF6055 domain-containing protein [Pedobacter cryoconitis]AMP98032.1 hypothetical protein AY601_1104 [Pedobacter cryoconitis]